MEKNIIEIAGRKIGNGQPTFIVAEMSANHNQNFEEAVRMIHAAKECGADAVKLQTYTPDTMTIDCHNDYFKIKGTPWEGETLYSLYQKAYTPWEWQPKLKKIADEIGIICFSTPFDCTAANFLEGMNVPAYKIASFELVDLQLIEHIASKGKPVIMSTGMATLNEIAEAVGVAREAGAEEIALLKCASSYPASPAEANLKTIPHLAAEFMVVSGLSDHTLGIATSIASVALGAAIIEKHFTLSRSEEGPDSSFSLAPEEFATMVEAVRTTEKAIGAVAYGITEQEVASKLFRRSLFVVKDIKAGEIFTEETIRSIRPGYGLAPRHLTEVIGRRASKDIARGTPLAWELVS